MQAGKTLKIGGLTLTKKQFITRPVLKQDKAIAFICQGPIFKAPDTGEGRKQKDANGNPMAPPDLMHVVDVTDGEEKTLVVNSVLGSEIKRAFPDDSYVGKGIAAEKSAPTGGKRYATYAIVEFDPNNIVREEKEAESTADAQAEKQPEPSPVPATGHKTTNATAHTQRAKR